MGSHFDSAIVFHNEISFLVSTFKYVCITIVCFSPGHSFKNVHSMGSHFDSAIVFHNEISFLVSTFKYVCITIVYKYASPFFSLMY